MQQASRTSTCKAYSQPRSTFDAHHERPRQRHARRRHAVDASTKVHHFFLPLPLPLGVVPDPLEATLPALDV